MCRKQLAGNTGRKNDSKKSPSGQHRTNLSGCIFATEACIDNRKKNRVKEQYLLHMSPQYGERRPTNGWDRFWSLGHPSKFQRVSHLAFIRPTAATSLTGGHPNSAQCLAVSWVVLIHYTHFQGLMTEFCPVQNSVYVQVLHSPILTALLHSTPAAGVSQTLRRGTRNYGTFTELSQRSPPIFGWAVMTLGTVPHSSRFSFRWHWIAYNVLMCR